MITLPQLIAHRGDRRYAPENTLAAFRQAKAKGARWVEFDATLTRELLAPAVIFHDDTAGRTTDLGDRPLNTLGFEELRAADAGSWFAPAFAGEKVPTLAETMTLCDELGLGMNIEIKLSAGTDEALAQLTARRVLEDVAAVRKGNWDNILFSSFSPYAVQVVREAVPEAACGFLLHQLAAEDAHDDSWPDLSAWLLQLQPHTLHLNHELIPDPSRFTQFRAVMHRALGRELPLLAYTVNEAARAKELFDWGIAALFTDAPGDLRAELSR